MYGGGDFTRCMTPYLSLCNFHTMRPVTSLHRSSEFSESNGSFAQHTSDLVPPPARSVTECVPKFRSVLGKVALVVYRGMCVGRIIIRFLSIASASR